MFNLAPRGFGRTSYRLAEIIQTGRIPIYLYDDYEWLPYRGTNISFNSLGYGLSIDGMNVTQSIWLAQEIASLVKDPIRIEKMLLSVQSVRPYYTYDGVMKQIELFLQDPFGSQGGYLTCTALPSDAQTHRY